MYVEAVNLSMLPNVLYIIGKGDLRAVYMFLRVALCMWRLSTCQC